MYNRFPLFWAYTVLVIISIAFVLSDWTIFYFSFGDFILGFGLLLILILGKLKISKQQFKIISLILFLLFISTLSAYLFKEGWIGNKRVTLSISKFIFYFFSTLVYYNFIVGNKLKGKFLNINNYLAIVIIVLGVILTVSIYLREIEFVRTVWYFTRQDYQSYYFAGNGDIIRTRSVFSEPAHLGYYLNIIFYSNFFATKKKNILVLSTIAFGITLTLSYSMILIFIITGFSMLGEKIIKKELYLSKWLMLLLVPLVILVYRFWELIDITIIKRTTDILNGTDGSAYNRIFESWLYVDKERIFYGNGIGHTPPITNIFAYALSEFGLIGFIPLILLTLKIVIKSIPVAILFITMNMAKGGYLNPTFWIFLLFIFIYGMSTDEDKNDL